ncbi:NO signaling/Golgi transport ligand-binding domain-containing protein [Dactylonectria estremocensis]|uniref:NO signaling/Golgi transport ligand-binding domain-containing protein n=1 Tax=Dactylonectria estremocensis TaxID=1079267 RepID=A0A9P9DN17_9HYPO|nr:NO signaling/Golgi transport ligand-binding domain-containing protein [Dactylonectria estremocensis]
MSANKASRVGEEYVNTKSPSRKVSKADTFTESGSMPFTEAQSRRSENLTSKNRTRIDKVNAELVTLTYGTIVAQLCKDYESDYVEVNKQLDRMGYNIGLRLIEDYLAKSNTMKRCVNFRETAEMIARVGFKIFLNITPQVTNWTSDNNQFSLVFDENPLADFVELPDDGRAQDQLWYSNILCGVLRGALEMVQMQVEAHFISDILRGNDSTEMRVSLIRYIDDELPPEDD